MASSEFNFEGMTVCDYKRQRIRDAKDCLSVCLPVFMEAYVRVWLMDIMHESESLSPCVCVGRAGNGPAEYLSLTLIPLPQASPTPTPADISYLLMSPHTDLIEGHLHTCTYISISIFPCVCCHLFSHSLYFKC